MNSSLLIPRKVPATSVRVPGGEIDFAELPGARLRLPADRARKRHLRLALDANAKLDSQQFLLPTLVAEAGSALEITYIPDCEEAASLANLSLGDVNRTARLSLALSCMRFVVNAWSQVAADSSRRLLPVSPPLIYLLPGRPAPWRIVPVPAAATSLGDWAESDSLCWSGLPQSAILSADGICDTSVLGSLFVFLWGGEHAGTPISQPRKFRRLLTGRVLDVRNLEAGIAAALPSSFSVEAAQLVALLRDLFASDPAARPTWQQAAERLQEVAGLLSLERLIARWKYEEQPSNVECLQRLAEEVFGQARKAPPTDPQEVSESPLANQIQQLFERIGEDGLGGVRRFLAMLTVVAHNEAELPLVRQALDRLVELDQQSLDASILDEAAQVHIAHLQARYLGADESKLRAILNRNFESSWNSAVVTALRSRILSGTEQYERVSQLCKRGIQLVKSMPDEGGSAGKYLRAYFQLLDGIANIGGAAKFRNVPFYADAFQALRTAWLDAHDCGGTDLADVAMRWMGQLSHSTRLLENTQWYVIHIGIEAFLRTQHVFVEALSAAGVPPLPWYDERRLLPG